MQTLFITGGAGFIGSALVRHLITNTQYHVINIDKLTYAGNLESINPVLPSDRYIFEHTDICNPDALNILFRKYEPDAVMHLAAESHVDRSIDGPAEFIETNIIGTYNLLEAARSYYSQLPGQKKNSFRFHHISTDEVYGSLGEQGMFTEETAYDPHSPYSASKASSDHLVRSWHHTFGLPVLVTNCSNNYGPYQFPEKMIPVMIIKALRGESLPVYGKGENVRDWLYVDDHVKALLRVLEKGEIGETYNIGGHNEKQNIEVVKSICRILDEIAPHEKIADRSELITYVQDRPGHDFRYAIDAGKIAEDLDWTPDESFETGLRKTIQWYLDNEEWWQRVISGEYRMQRLGKSGTLRVDVTM